MKVKNLSYFDKAYTQNIRDLIKKLKGTNEIDELIIMSDHGPRLEKYAFASKNLIEGSIEDNNLHGYFLYRVKISNPKSIDHHFNFTNLVPTAKKRYSANDYGIPNEVKVISSI